MSSDIIDFQKRIVKYGVWRTCLNCDHFLPDGCGPGKPRCKLYNAVPPTETIVLSCPGWIPTVPF